MVLEHLFPEDWLEQKTRYSFLLGIGYSLIGILIAAILFPDDPALVAVAFTSLLLLPELDKIFAIEERQEHMDEKFDLKHLWSDDKDVAKIWIFLFLGILLTYAIGSLILPSFQLNNLFREQLEIRGALQGAAGAATFTSGLFWDLLGNNFLVLLAIFIIGLLTGDGSIFLITWNASVWGTIFGITARNAAVVADTNPLVYFGLVMLIVFPHMLIEALAYVFAAISAGILSKDVLLEQFNSERFWFVFKFNFYLLIIALLTLVLGALVETFVLDNATIYHEIILQSLAAG